MTPEERATHQRLHQALANGDHDTVRQIEAQLDAEDRATIQRLTAPGALRDAAIYYATTGIPVFPLEPGIGRDREGKARGKKPLFPRAHPRDEKTTCRGECGKVGHGLWDATTDVTLIRSWWAATPQANIGIRTGDLFTVIDIDVPEGWDSLAKMRAAGRLPKICGRVATPSGGTHLYVPPTGEGNAGKVIPGIDIRGVGGYTVAPPSKSEDGMWLWTSRLDLDGITS